MLVILLVGLLAIVASAVGLFLARRAVPARPRVSAPPSSASPKHRELADLFTARLRSGAIGIPDLIRLLRREGRSQDEITRALQDAMSRFPQFARRRDKLEEWLREAARA